MNTTREISYTRINVGRWRSSAGDGGGYYLQSPGATPLSDDDIDRIAAAAIAVKGDVVVDGRRWQLRISEPSLSPEEQRDAWLSHQRSVRAFPRTHPTVTEEWGIPRPHRGREYDHEQGWHDVTVVPQVATCFVWRASAKASYSPEYRGGRW